MNIFITVFMNKCGPGSTVGITTGYELDGPGIESRLGRYLRTCPDRPWGQPSFLYNSYRVFPGSKERQGRDADPSTPSSAVVKKEESYTSTSPKGRTACTEPQCLYKGALYLYLYLSITKPRSRTFEIILNYFNYEPTDTLYTISH